MKQRRKIFTIKKVLCLSEQDIKRLQELSQALKKNQNTIIRQAITLLHSETCIEKEEPAEPFNEFKKLQENIATL